MTSPVDARTIVDALPMPVAIVDPDDVVVAANAAAIGALFHTPRSPVGKKFKDVVMDALRGPLAHAIGDAKRAGRPQVLSAASSANGPGDTNGPRQAAATIHVRPITCEDRRVVAVVIAAQDDADDRLLSAQLQVANAELQAANDELATRLEELRHAHHVDEERNRFLAMLAHELRNPLAGITNALYLLRRRYAGAGDRLIEQALRIAQRQARNQARLLDDLLDVSRIVLGKITLRVAPTDLVAVARHAIEASELEIRSRGQTLHAALPEGSIAIMGDPVRLEQIVANLLHNAVKYTSPGGEIRVALTTTSDAVTLTVSDTGMGMEPELLGHVFELFTQGDATRSRAAGGLGIGLTVVRQLVELHRGTITAYSRGRGHGSTFEVQLPRSDAITPTPATPASASGTPSRRVLVVDDNRDARELLRTILELDGHVVQDAADAANAVRLAVERTPEIVLIDIGLPEVDGYEVARRIRKRLGNAVRLIALTGYGDAEARRLAADAGFDEYLVKPVDPDRLSEVLAAA